MPAQEHTEFHQLVFVTPFGEVEADEALARGYLSHVLVETSDGRLYPVTFYDPVRLRQDLEERSSQGSSFLADPGMVVIPEITASLMEAAARGLCKEGFFDHFRPITRDQLAAANAYEWPPRVIRET